MKAIDLESFVITLKNIHESIFENMKYIYIL